MAAALTGGALSVWETPESALDPFVKRPLGRLPSRCVALAASPSGAYLLCGCQEGDVVGWNVPAGEPLFSDKDHAGPVTSAAYSMDGRWTATGGEDGQVVVRDASGDPWFKTPAHADGVTAVRFGPEGRLLTGGRDGSIRFWSMPSGRLERDLPGHTGAVRALAVSPDGRRLFSAGDDATVRVWDTETGRILLTLKHRFGPLRALRVCRSGRRVAAADPRGLTVWDCGPLEPTGPSMGLTAGP